MSSVAIKKTVAVALVCVVTVVIALAVIEPVEAGEPVRLCPTADMKCPSRSGVSGA